VISGKDPEKTLGAVDEYSTQRRYLGRVLGFRGGPACVDGPWSAFRKEVRDEGVKYSVGRLGRHQLSG